MSQQDVTLRVKTEGGQDSAQQISGIQRQIERLRKELHTLATAAQGAAGLGHVAQGVVEIGDASQSTVSGITHVAQGLAELTATADEASAAIDRQIQAQLTGVSATEAGTAAATRQTSVLVLAAAFIIKMVAVHMAWNLAAKLVRENQDKIRAGFVSLAARGGAMRAVWAGMAASMAAASAMFSATTTNINRVNNGLNATYNAGRRVIGLPWRTMAVGVGAGVGLWALSKGVGAVIRGAMPAATIEPTQKAFEALSRSINTTSDALMMRLRAATRHTVTDVEIMKGALLGLSTEVVKTPEIAGELVAGATMIGAQRQTDPGEALDALIRGTALRDSGLIKNATGMLVDFEAAMTGLGKSASKTEKDNAALNATLTTMRRHLELTGEQTEYLSAEAKVLFNELAHLTPGTSAYAKVLNQLKLETLRTSAANATLLQTQQQATTAMKNFFMAVSGAISRSSELKGFLTEARILFTLLGAAIDSDHSIITSLVDGGFKWLKRDLEDINSLVDDAVVTWGWLSRIWKDMKGGAANALAGSPALQAAAQSGGLPGGGFATFGTRVLGSMYNWATGYNDSLAGGTWNMTPEAAAIAGMQMPEGVGQSFSTGGIDPEVLSSMAESSRGELHQLRAQIQLVEEAMRNAFSEQNVEAFDQHNDDWVKLNESLEEAQRKYQLLQPFLKQETTYSLADFAGVGGVGGAAGNLEHLHALGEWLQNSRDQARDLQLEMSRTYEILASGLVQEGSDEWKQMTDQLAQSRDELAQLGVVGERVGRTLAEAFPRERLDAAFFARLGEDLEKMRNLAPRLSVPQVQRDWGRIDIPVSSAQAARSRGTVGSMLTQGMQIDVEAFRELPRLLEQAGITTKQYNNVLQAMNLGMDATHIQTLIGVERWRELESTLAKLGLTVEDFSNDTEDAQREMAAAGASIVHSVFGALQAVAGGFEQIESVVVQTMTNILASTVAKNDPILGAVITGIGGLFTSLMGRNKERTQPVRIDEYSTRALQQRTHSKEPETVILQIISPETGEMISETTYAMKRNERRDARVRIPAAAR